MHNEKPPFQDVCAQYVHCLSIVGKHEVTVAFLHGKMTSNYAAKEVIRFNFSKWAMSHLKIPAILTVLRFCRQKKFDVVICHRYQPSYIMLWVARICKIKRIVFVIHGLHSFTSCDKQWLFTTLIKKNMLLAGVSNAVRDDLRKSLPQIPKEQIQTLYNAISIEKVEKQLLSREEARNFLQLAPHDFIFCHMARLHPEKDQYTLIHAFHHLQNKIMSEKNNVKLVILGRGKEEEYLKKLTAELDLKDSVLFLGHIAQGYRYLKAFDGFILSSKEEAFGRVLLEAMIAKLPIIATQVYGIPEVVGGAGLLVPAGQPEPLAVAMQQIINLSPQAVFNLREKGYERVKNYFSIPIFREQLLALLDE